MITLSHVTHNVRFVSAGKQQTNVSSLLTFSIYKRSQHSYELKIDDAGYVPIDQLDARVQKSIEGYGKSFYINNTGHLAPSTTFNNVCITYNEDFSKVKYSSPLTVDGSTYRVAIAVNGLVPGPTLVVHEGQVIVANVINELLTESVSIHWHGMHQRNTPWMDGPTHISQCPIGPAESFQYYFKAAPTGSFWYHFHVVTQRADGLFGALIVCESPKHRTMLKNALNISTITDSPGNQTIVLHEWDRLSHIARYTVAESFLNFYPDKPLGRIPLPLEKQPEMGVAEAYSEYEVTRAPDGLSVGPFLFFSGLIDGKGRNKDVPFSNTRLEIFNVERGNVYHFRLIGAQNLFPYKFSIDEHNLTVIVTDGSFIEPVETQFIILHDGESYDFLLKANKPR